jgi:hypothetical protein
VAASVDRSSRVKSETRPEIYKRVKGLDLTVPAARRPVADRSLKAFLHARREIAFVPTATGVASLYFWMSPTMSRRSSPTIANAFLPFPKHSHDLDHDLAEKGKINGSGAINGEDGSHPYALFSFPSLSMHLFAYADSPSACVLSESTSFNPTLPTRPACELPHRTSPPLSLSTRKSDAIRHSRMRRSGRYAGKTGRRPTLLYVPSYAPRRCSLSELADGILGLRFPVR